MCIIFFPPPVCSPSFPIWYACMECNIHTYTWSSMLWSPILLGYINDTYICAFLDLLFFFSAFSLPSFLFLKGLSHLMMGEQGKSLLFRLLLVVEYDAPCLACISLHTKSSLPALHFLPLLSFHHSFAELCMAHAQEDNPAKIQSWACWQWVDVPRGTCKERCGHAASLHSHQPFCLCFGS